MKRKYYLKYLRTISCILVVFVHVSALFFSTTTVRSFDWNIVNLYDCAGIVGVPLFVMISGALHLDSDYELTGKRLFKKTLRLFVIFYLWTLIGNIVYMIQLEQPITLSLIKNEVFLRTLKRYYMSHLWFLPMLITLYIITPILRQVVRNRQVTKYLLILLFVLEIAIPTALKFTFPYKWALAGFYEFHTFSLASPYLFYYILGHYIDTYMPEITPRQHKVTVALGIVFFILQVSACSIDSWFNNVPSGILNEPFALTMVPICISIFIVAKKGTANRIPGRLLTLLSTYSLGIYLLHLLVIWQLDFFCITTINIPLIIRIPLLVFICVIICIPINYLIGKIPKINRYIQ